jgi:ATP-dependent helicase HrpB
LYEIWVPSVVLHMAQERALGHFRLVMRPLTSYERQMPREWLPVDDLEPEIVAALEEGNRLVLQAPTGSGKSTRLPQILLRRGLLGNAEVVVLQPRRLAARLLASFVAREMGVRLGAEVGYQIRLDNVTSETTRIRYVTEGIVLRQLVSDPLLGGIGTLVFDEFHERHLYGDVTLARALDLQENERPDLRIVVMSATLDASGLKEYLKPCQVLRSDGRVFPVEVDYWPHRIGPKAVPVWDRAVAGFERSVDSSEGGDVLIFMPGAYEIQRTLAALRSCGAARGRLQLPLYGDLPAAGQDAAVARYDRPKIVVSTNVAETSVTIDGVRLVIDSGLARVSRYDPNRGINTLLVERISQAAADQRAGRAGRTAPGRCLRLWSEREHEERPAHQTPEVQRLELSEVVLALKASGVRDLGSFRWLEPPAVDSLRQAEVLLNDLGALDRSGAITQLGRAMLAFPLHPRYARMLLAAAEQRCVRRAALAAALTQGRDLFVRNPGVEVVRRRASLLGDRGTSDFSMLTRAWDTARSAGFRLEVCRGLGIHAGTARQVGSLWEQFLDIARREGLDTEADDGSDEALRRCILVGFSDRVARRLDTGTLRCELVHRRRGTLARESVVADVPLLVAAEIREVQSSRGEVATHLSLATAVERSWLQEMFAEDVQTTFAVLFDPGLRRVVGQEKEMFRDLELSVRGVEPPPTDLAARVLAEEVLKGAISLPNWNHGVEQWVLRVNLLAKWCPELELPGIGDEDRRHLIEQVCHGAFSARELRDREVRNVVMGWLSARQRALVEKQVPERLDLANGRTPKVVYNAANPPHVALRIQELFGLDAVPSVALGRVPVLVHILAPNMRPVQVTQDLRGFWREHYPRVKQELQRKYPKHEWR